MDNPIVSIFLVLLQFNIDVILDRKPVKIKTLQFYREVCWNFATFLAPHSETAKSENPVFIVEKIKINLSDLIQSSLTFGFTLYRTLLPIDEIICASLHLNDARFELS